MNKTVDQLREACERMARELWGDDALTEVSSDANGWDANARASTALKGRVSVWGQFDACTALAALHAALTVMVEAKPKSKPRSDVESRRWLVANPLETVERYYADGENSTGVRYRWNPERACFESQSRQEVTWYTSSGPAWACIPADDKPWGDVVAGEMP